MNECPIDGCTARTPSHLLMCSAHWWVVPAWLRNPVWRAYKRNGVLSSEYRQARDKAIAHVNAELSSGGRDAPTRATAHTPRDRGVGSDDEAGVLPATAATEAAAASEEAERSEPA